MTTLNADSVFSGKGERQEYDSNLTTIVCSLSQGSKLGCSPYGPTLTWCPPSLRPSPQLLKHKHTETQSVQATLPNTGRFVLHSGRTLQTSSVFPTGQLTLSLPVSSWAFSIPASPPPNGQTCECLCVSDAAGMTNMIHLITCFSLAD